GLGRCGGWAGAANAHRTSIRFAAAGSEPATRVPWHADRVAITNLLTTSYLDDFECNSRLGPRRARLRSFRRVIACVALAGLAQLWPADPLPWRNSCVRATPRRSSTPTTLSAANPAGTNTGRNAACSRSAQTAARTGS